MSNNRLEASGYGTVPLVDDTPVSCPINNDDDDGPTTAYLSYEGSKPGKSVKAGTELRILCVGDSITFGRQKADGGGDGNGYRLRLKDDLSSKTKKLLDICQPSCNAN